MNMWSDYDGDAAGRFQHPMYLGHPLDGPGRIVGLRHAAVLDLTLVGVHWAGADQIDDFSRQLSDDVQDNRR